MDFGERVKKYRLMRGLSQKELAKRMNISQQAVAKFEKTKIQPKISTARNFAEALGVTVGDLVTDSFQHFIPCFYQYFYLYNEKKNPLSYLLSSHYFQFVYQKYTNTHRIHHRYFSSTSMVRSSGAGSDSLSWYLS